MAYVYSKVTSLHNKPKVGDKDCVALVRYYADVPDHRQWTEGEKVLDNKNVKAGTAIATFVKGKYPSHKTGNHAAFFLRHGAPGTGFWVMDQWKRPDKPAISPRFINSRKWKQNSDGSWPGASDNADAFSIIE